MSDSNTRPDSVGQAHTPTPWTFVPWHIEEGPPAVRAPEGWVVAHTASDSDAEFIARAANCHDELLAKLKEVLDFYDALPTAHAVGEVELLDSITTLIAKATGGQP